MTLSRRTPLTRTAPQRRTPIVRSRTRPATPRPSGRARDTGPDAATRTKVAGRDNSRCINCGKPASNLQHRTARGMGGTSNPAVNSPAQLLSMCGSGTTGCHGWTETNRAAARALGWAILRSDQRDPATIPVRTSRGWELFDHDGRREPCPAPDQPEPESRP